MVLLESEVPINLEVLDPAGRPISGIAATLMHLDGHTALIAIERTTPAPCLHWGARVRFWVENGASGYEVTGAVIAQDVRPPYPALITEDDPTAEVRVRLFECHTRVQRRDSPRRRTRIAVRFAEVTGAFDDEAEPLDNKSPAESTWRNGITIDVAPGGLRLRTDRLESAPEHVVIEFALPAGDRHGAGRSLRLRGRVLRHEASRRADSSILAVKFRQLTVEEGLALTNFVLH